MGWDEIDYKLKIRTFSYFVDCSDKSEMNYLKQIILEEFPNLKEKKIRMAISESCRELIPPHSRYQFLKHLRQKLNHSKQA